MEVQEAAVAALAADPAAAVLVEEASEVPLVITIIIITAPISVGDSARAVITAVAAEDALAR